MNIWRVMDENYRPNWLSITILENGKLVILKHKNSRTFSLNNLTPRLNISLLQKKNEIANNAKCRNRIIHYLAHKTNFIKYISGFLYCDRSDQLIWLLLGSFVLLSFGFSCGFSRLEFIFHRLTVLACIYRWATVGLLLLGFLHCWFVGFCTLSCIQECFTGSAFSPALYWFKIRIWYILFVAFEG
jgi:hypothetical protein